MIISSTEFQQKVGYYLKLAEEGNTVNIVKSKPSKQQFELKVVKANVKKIKNKYLENVFKQIETQKNKFDFYGEDSVKHVRSIRE